MEDEEYQRPRMGRDRPGFFIGLQPKRGAAALVETAAVQGPPGPEQPARPRLSAGVTSGGIVGRGLHGVKPLQQWVDLR